MKGILIPKISWSTLALVDQSPPCREFQRDLPSRSPRWGEVSIVRLPVIILASQARGVTVESFLETQKRLVDRFESGFSGYRGLAGHYNILTITYSCLFSGSLDSHPSQVVENILQSMRPPATGDSSLPGATSVPSRFRLLTAAGGGFHSLVQQVTQDRAKTGFKQAAKTLINANKERDVNDEVNGKELNEVHK